MILSANLLLKQEEGLMRKLEIKDAEIIKASVLEEIQRSEESRYDHRLHGILLACAGFNSTQIAEILGHGRRTIQYWIRNFEKSGFAGLQETPRAGRPTAVDKDLEESISNDLRKSPSDFGYSQTLWDGKLLSKHLADYYGIHLGVRQCQRLFHKLGFRLRKPRPVIAKADPEAQRAYKKTSKPRETG